MPFVDGETLRQRLDREGALPVEEALRITREAGQALHYAHGQGVIHRDVKPENILLTRNGSTLVADFGVAKAAGAGAQTQPGVLVGTPVYMSPEQCIGDGSLDARSDIYSLATVCYEMLAGKSPFAGERGTAILARRFAEKPPPLRAKRADVPAGVERALERALAVNPEDRFASMAEFVQALDSGRSGDVVTTGAVRAGTRRARRVALAVAAALAVVAGALVSARYLSHRRAAAAVPMRIAVLPFENVGDSGQANFAEGVSDAVRGKLAALPGLEVIARGRSRSPRPTRCAVTAPGLAPTPTRRASSTSSSSRKCRRTRRPTHSTR
jgi:serine/threonine-protein kinase